MDPKIKICINELDELVNEGHKILYFSKYKDTVLAFILALKNLNYDMSKIAVYSGDGGAIFLNGEERSVEKSAITHLLDEGALNVIICTDAASEGLNLQSADVEVHIDVPWNPAKLEQRIGRIDRLGQVKKQVLIKYLWYPDQESIEYRMLRALIDRLGFSKITIGPVQSIISSAFEEIISENAHVGKTIEKAIDEINRTNESSLKIFSEIRITSENKNQYKPEIEDLSLKILIFLAAELGKKLVITNERIELLQDEKCHSNTSSANLIKGKKNYLTLSHPIIKNLLDELRLKYTDNNISNNSVFINSHRIGVYNIEYDHKLVDQLQLHFILNNINKILDDISNSSKEDSL